jgi:hypothetical protein
LVVVVVGIVVVVVGGNVVVVVPARVVAGEGPVLVDGPAEDTHPARRRTIAASPRRIRSR